MRQILLGIGAYVASQLVIPYVWDRVVSSAPDWALRSILFASTLICLLVVAFSDPLYSRLTNPKSAPVASTVIAASLMFCVVAAGWWFFLAAPASQKNVPPPGLRARQIQFTRSQRASWIALDHRAKERARAE